jgi:hypothetical protein
MGNPDFLLMTIRTLDLLAQKYKCEQVVIGLQKLSNIVLLVIHMA